MNKKQVWALVLIALVVIVLVLNRGGMDLNLVVTELSGLKALFLLAFTAIGVLIGTLLK
jgi:hypothetical protein